jgi:hypothetical protein
LVEKDVGGSTLIIPFAIENRSNVTARNLKIDIEYGSSAYIPNDLLRKLLIKSGEADLVDHPFLLSRHASILDSSTRVHYELDTLHPYEELVGSEILRWEEPLNAHHEKVYEDDRFSGSGFANILRRISGIEGFGYFDVVSVTYSAENLKPKTHFLNLSVLRTDERNIREIAMSIAPNDRGERVIKLKKSGTRAEAFLERLTVEYRRCFWMGDLPALAFVPFPMRLQRSEGGEVVPVVSPHQRNEKEIRLVKKHGLSSSNLMIGTSVTFMKLSMPWRNYYRFPRWVNSIERLIIYHFGWSISRRTNKAAVT